MVERGPSPAAYSTRERALVLLYAATRLRESVADWVSAEAIAEAEETSRIVREDSAIGLAFLREIEQQPDVAWALEGLRTSVLLIHGVQDLEVDCAQSEDAAQAGRRAGEARGGARR